MGWRSTLLTVAVLVLPHIGIAGAANSSCSVLRSGAPSTIQVGAATRVALDDCTVVDSGVTFHILGPNATLSLGRFRLTGVSTLAVVPAADNIDGLQVHVTDSHIQCRGDALVVGESTAPIANATVSIRNSTILATGGRAAVMTPSLCTHCVLAALNGSVVRSTGTSGALKSVLALSFVNSATEVDIVAVNATVEALATGGIFGVAAMGIAAVADQIQIRGCRVWAIASFVHARTGAGASAVAALGVAVHTDRGAASLIAKGLHFVADAGSVVRAWGERDGESIVALGAALKGRAYTVSITKSYFAARGGSAVTVSSDREADSIAVLGVAASYKDATVTDTVFVAEDARVEAEFRGPSAEACAVLGSAVQGGGATITLKSVDFWARRSTILATCPGTDDGVAVVGLAAYGGDIDATNVRAAATDSVLQGCGEAANSVTNGDAGSVARVNSTVGCCGTQPVTGPNVGAQCEPDATTATCVTMAREPAPPVPVREWRAVLLTLTSGSPGAEPRTPSRSRTWPTASLGRTRSNELAATATRSPVATATIIAVPVIAESQTITIAATPNPPPPPTTTVAPRRLTPTPSLVLATAAPPQPNLTAPTEAPVPAEALRPAKPVPPPEAAPQAAATAVSAGLAAFAPGVGAGASAGSARIAAARGLGKCDGAEEPDLVALPVPLATSFTAWPGCPSDEVQFACGLAWRAVLGAVATAAGCLGGVLLIVHRVSRGMGAAAITVAVTYVAPGAIEASLMVLTRTAPVSTALIAAAASIVVVFAAACVIRLCVIEDVAGALFPTIEEPTASSSSKSATNVSPGIVYLGRRVIFVEGGFAILVAAAAGTNGGGPESALCVGRAVGGSVGAVVFTVYVAYCRPLARDPNGDPWEHAFQLVGALLQTLQCILMVALAAGVAASDGTAGTVADVTGMATAGVFLLAAVVLAVRSVLRWRRDHASESSAAGNSHHIDAAATAGANEPSATLTVPLLVRSPPADANNVLKPANPLAARPSRRGGSSQSSDGEPRRTNPVAAQRVPNMK